MKQRVRVTSIIKGESGVLVLKRSRGRGDAPVFWELPTDKIKFGEQPEEAMARVLSEHVGLKVSFIKIRDVITFIALEGSSRLNNLYIIYDVETEPSAKPAPSGPYTAYRFLKDFSPGSLNGIHLNEASLSALEIIAGKVGPSHASTRSGAYATAVYVDGASRGNPGPSGIGYCIIDANGSSLARGGEFIGFATSRMAEYYAMRSAIERALSLGIKSAKFLSDSLMVVNQLNGIFKVKNADIAPIYNDIQKMIPKFDSVSFSHIPREENLIADGEANAAIDSIMRR